MSTNRITRHKKDVKVRVKVRRNYRKNTIKTEKGWKNSINRIKKSLKDVKVRVC